MSEKLHRFIIDRDKYHLLEDIAAWCWETIGEGSRVFNIDLLTVTNIDWHSNRWLVKTTFGTSIFVFRESKDAVLFALKWQD